jgi:hypothetical protein
MYFRSLGLMAVMLAGAGWASAQAPATLQFPAPPPPGPASAAAAPGCSAAPAVDAVGGGGLVFYGSADYLLWQIRKGRLPDATTTIPVGLISVDISDLFQKSPTGPATPGTPTVGFAPVSIVNRATFGDGPFTNVGSQSGARFGLGFWIDEDMTCGMEAGFFFLERGTDKFAAVTSNPGNQFLVDTGFHRTVFLTQTTTVLTPGGPVVTTTQTPLRTFDVFVPRQSSSSLVGNASVNLYGAELNARGTVLRFGGLDIGGLAGFRFLEFKDELSVLSNVRLFRPPGLALTDADLSASLSGDLTFSTVDRVRVWNYFYGGQVGLDFDGKCGPFFLNARVKAAVGNMHQVAQVEGATTVINNDVAPRLSPAGFATGGGLLSAPGDNGRHTRERFAFIPEGSVKLGYQVTDWLRAYAGYDILVLGHAARAGSSTAPNTLDTNIRVANTTVNASIEQPTFRFRDQDVWVQGLTFGIETKY